MSDNEIQEQPSSAPQAGETSETQAPETEAPRGLETAGLRFSHSSDVPEYLRGRTISETIKIMEDMYGALQHGASSSPPPTPQPTMQPSAPPPSPGGIPSVDPNLLYSNPEEYHRQMEARQEAIISARLGAAQSSVVTPMVSMAKAQAQTHRPEIWKRYGPEIEATMAQLDPASRANVDVWKKIVNYVAGEHVDEIAEARAQQLRASASDSGMLTGAGSAPPTSASPSSSPLDKLFSEQHPAVKGFIQDGISVAQVRKHMEKQGYSDEAAYVDILMKRVNRRTTSAR